jgi:LacI family transcriptional regulator
MRVTLKDIASAVGVDPSAVSLALSDRTAGKLSVDRVRQIREVATRMGYRPNPSAAHLRKGKTHCIGVVLDYLDHYPFNHYFNLISHNCRLAGYYAVPLATHRLRLTDAKLDLGQVHVDGMILLDYMPENGAGDLEDRLSHPLVCRYTDPSIPRPDFPSVLVDDYQSARALLKHVLQRGWRQLRVVVEDDPNRPPVDGEAPGLSPAVSRAIADALSEHGVNQIDLNEILIRTPGRLAKHRYDAMLAWLKTNTLEPGTCLLHEGADGISGTYSALSRAGYRVGCDLAVAALNATPPWEHVQPVADCVYEEAEKIARLLVELAVDSMEQTGRFARDAHFTFTRVLEPAESVPPISNLV